MTKKHLFFLIYLILLLAIAFVLYRIRPLSKVNVSKITPTEKPTPTPFVFTSYSAPKIESKKVYKIVLIGDSMTAALGPHGGELSEYMNNLYKKTSADPQRIIIDNYAKSSNILVVDEELLWKTTVSEYTLQPLLSTDFDLILIESYGYNPLSQFGLEEGLRQQNNSLDKLMAKIITARPQAAIIFITTIAPNIANYAKNTQPNNSDAERSKLAQERIAYLKNHNEYAKMHKIPLINIYEKSLTGNGDGDMKYINTTDDIHPSFQGVTFISHQIADFIHDNQILPN